MPTLAEKRAFSRRMRLNPTLAEATLWTGMLARRQLLGLRFRRQHILLGWIVDFYCPEAGLVIEVDGEYHERSERLNPDLHRDNAMYAKGLIVVRVQNAMVLAPDGILAITGALTLSLSEAVTTGVVPPPTLLCTRNRATVPRWRGYSKAGSYRPAGPDVCAAQPVSA